MEKNNAPAIIVRNVSKRFKIYQDKPTTLKERFLYRSKGVFQENWVLRDITLTIEKGKMVALIGRNGSGKSTLLKLMTKIIKPDHGEIEINGRVSSLLELGAGFHMDFTGRENIYLNASIFGLTRKEIDDRLEDIIRFSELESFIDNPVRTYSSGMYMRLAFSIAIHVEPDILLIDEILAVGDNAFQKKCINRIEQLKDEGKTIVFVSHDNGTIERLFDEVYWIHDSRIKKHGKPREVVRDYLDFLAEAEENRLAMESLKSKSENQDAQETESSELIEKNAPPNSEKQANRWGNKAVEITNVNVMSEGQEKHVFEKGKPMSIQIQYVQRGNAPKPTFGIGIFRADGVCCFGTNTFIDNEKLELQQNGHIKFEIENLNLIQGQYYLDVACHHEDGTPYDYISKVLYFHVHSREEEVGIAYLPHKWVF